MKIFSDDLGKQKSPVAGVRYSIPSESQDTPIVDLL